MPYLVVSQAAAACAGVRHASAFTASVYLGRQGRFRDGDWKNFERDAFSNGRVAEVLVKPKPGGTALKQLLPPAVEVPRAGRMQSRMVESPRT